jgi:hypothetical protein
MQRRQLLRTSSSGFGYLAFSALAHSESAPAKAQQPHFAPKAKSVIFLCMQGGPSHVDTFDYKPKLTADTGKSGPAVAGGRGRAPLLGSPWSFKQHGRSGLWISELFPNLAKQADDLCLLRGMATDVPAHAQAFIQMHTGTAQFVRPSLGAWSLYGLGSVNQNMPGFIALNAPANASRAFGSAFLPATYQATRIGSPRGFGGAAQRFGGGMDAQLPNIKNPRLSPEAQRSQLDFVQALNRQQLSAAGGESPEIEGVIQSYELAFRMQSEVPTVMDLDSESSATKALYGIGEQATDAFGKQCLMARKFVEAGVRFIELSHGNWDHHRNLKTDMERNCGQIDKPIAGLLADLKQRGLLKDTLVIWGGEFGRTPHSQANDGRDHNAKGYTMFMAGGGVKGGLSYGATDEYGYEAVEGRMHIHDWHATVLALLGLDHEKLTYRYAGRDFRLTDVYGTVAKEIMA